MEITNYQIKKGKKYTITEIKRIARGYKQLWLSYLTKEKGISYLTMIAFHRVDIHPNFKRKYTKETYILSIDKGREDGFDIFNKDLVIEERHEFRSIQEIVDYLDKKNYLKKGKWVRK